MSHLFTYGTLMFEPVWRSIVDGRYRSERAELSGFQRYAVKGEDYPVIKPGGTNARVEGVVYFDISGRDLSNLDAFEGIYYQRSKVTLNTDSGPLSADAYILRPRFYCLASAKPWDSHHFEKHRLKRFMRLYPE